MCRDEVDGDAKSLQLKRVLENVIEASDQIQIGEGQVFKVGDVVLQRVCHFQFLNISVLDDEICDSARNARFDPTRAAEKQP